MDGSSFQAARGYRLDTFGGRQGVSCDEAGPALGPIRLLTKVAAGWQPRTREDLNGLLRKIFATPVDSTSLLPGLRAIARSLDEGNMARAMIGTQLLQLPVLSETQAHRAMAIKLLAKASPDDPEHPGWPANAPDDRGGQFRPKDEQASDGVRRAVVKATRRRLYRRAIREGLRRLLNIPRLGRLAVEVSSNVLPGVDVVADAAAAVDVADMVSELNTLHKNTDIAIEFASGGPRTLEELQVSPQEESFPSYDAFKKDLFEEDLLKRFGPAGDGYEYHHIVEQGPESGIPDSDIQSTRNIVRIPKLLHEEISSEYGQNESEMNISVRASMRGKSFEEQWERGLRAMRNVGILQ